MARSRFLRHALAVSGAALLLGLGIAGWGYSRLRASLPRLDGTAPLPGLSAAVSAERDALGTPTLRGSTRPDLAAALGWLHAQDRFFQMDLMRRRAAGELAALLGKRALETDRANRLHDFRAYAEAALARLPADQRELLRRYTEGVNAGLAALGSKPWEYHFLRATPRPWSEADSLLVGYALTLDLQSPGEHERNYATVRNILGEQAARFFAPLSGPDDEALDGTRAPLADIPPASAINLRATKPANNGANPAEGDAPGSNAFALAGTRTASGAALLACDMHLGLRVPGPWYRAVLEWSDGLAPHRVAGLTLPGLPLVLVGTNGSIAWGFTNSYADTSDLIIVEPPSTDARELFYRRAGDVAEYTTRQSLIEVKGEEPVPFSAQWTEWGPIIGEGERSRRLALAWTAHSADAIDLTIGQLETADDAREAVAIAQRAGLPALNFIVGDRTGATAWTIAGRLPNRIGFDGRLPALRTYRDRRWDGFLPPEQHPVHVAGASGQIVSANQRHLGGEALATLGDGGYSAPYRARQIREDLERLTRATPGDLLAVQLDDRAGFLTRWQQLACRVLTPEAVSGRPNRAEFLQEIIRWSGRADTDSTGYRLVREFREATLRLSLTPIFAPCAAKDERFSWATFDIEPAVWALLEQKPAHLLAPDYADWDTLLLAAVDATLEKLKVEKLTPAQARWGQYNRTAIRHPLSSALPGCLARFLDMPDAPQAGDRHMPRVAQPGFGASERLVVSPGAESEGILQTPAGQSGHPLSPFYQAGHEAWLRGEPTPLLPGPAQHRIVFTP